MPSSSRTFADHRAMATNGIRTMDFSLGRPRSATLPTGGAGWCLGRAPIRKKLSIVGWSYGGYAALQSGVLAPDLFKAIVAIAPVTDLQQLKDEESGTGAARINAKFIGTGPHIREGSPAQNADAIKVPVLMFLRQFRPECRHLAIADDEARARGEGKAGRADRISRTRAQPRNWRSAHRHAA